MPDTECLYCAFDGGNNIFRAKEMMFGFMDEFEYSQCSKCSSLRMVTPLSSFEMAKYYPKNYYSLSFDFGRPPRLKSFLYNRLARHLNGKHNLIGYAIQYVKPSNKLVTVMKAYGVGADASVLDVGCGNGKFLAFLREAGFHNLRGCDPYVTQPITATDIEISKSELSDVSGSFDAVFFNHSFEHVPNPQQTLMAARARQRIGGRCIIRVPTTSSLAFEKYGANWVQLDAPRHLSIPSRDGMRCLAQTCGYRIASTVDDSNPLQFWGSEQYIRNIPHRSARSYGTDPRKSIFSRSQIAEFRRLASDLNAQQRGDQTAFILVAA